MRRSVLPLLAIVAAACAPATPESEGAAEAANTPVTLGPADGLDLPGGAPDRVAVGDVAPDFALESFRGDTLTLSEYVGKREVILVFYRGAW